MKYKEGVRMDSKFTVTYSNRDIMEKLDKIHDQTIITNGTVKEHTKQLTAQKTLIYGCYAFIFTVATTILFILL